MGARSVLSINCLIEINIMEKSISKRKNSQPWQQIVAKYQNPIRIKSIFQLANTFVLYVIAWVVMVKFLKISFWLMFPVAVIAAGFMVRLFIIFHDCGHGSYFKSQKANNFWGFVTGVLIFTPYHHWWHEHAVHHSRAGNLDERGWGDVWTMTVQEYCKASRWTKIKYRFARNPICLFIIGPPILFFIVQRFPSGKIGKRGRRSAHQTNLGILAMATIMSFFIGFKAYFLIQLLVLSIASSVGIWLFYLQHQFEGVYWERHTKWDYVTEALKGSSYLKLPRSVEEEAARIYRLALQKGLVRGRSMESVIAGALYAACRRHEVPRTLDEMGEASGIEKKEIGRTYRFVTRELEISIRPSNPADYIPRFASALKLSAETQSKSVESLEMARDIELTSGRGPTGIAAAALYVSSLIHGEKRTQREVADVAGVTEVTIRNRYKELIKKLKLTKEVEKSKKK